MADPAMRDGASPAPYALEVTSTPKAPKKICVRFLDKARGMLTHYGPGGSVPCGAPGWCEPKLHRTRQIWKGYASALLWKPKEQGWVRTVVEITEAVAEYMDLDNLRGQEWELERVVNDKGHKIVRGTFCAQLQPSTMGKADVIDGVLLRFYRVSSIRLDVENPLPKRVLYGLVEGTPPARQATEEPPAITLPVPQLEPGQPPPAAPKKKKEPLPKLSTMFRMPGNGNGNGNGNHS